MKRTIIGALVGAALIFIWQAMSWMMLPLHEPANKYTPNEGVLLQALAANLPEEGGYMLPGMAPGYTRDQCDSLMKASDGKPYAMIQYHKSHNASMSAMTMNMVRGFLSNFIMVLLLLWILNRITLRSFSTIFIACLSIGLITFINQPYTGHIWYEFFDIWGYLVDSIVSWSLCGLWLGWWMNRRPA